MTGSGAVVGVVGAGIMGHGIAQALAAGGHAVLLGDQNLKVATAGREAVERNLESLVRGGHVLPEDGAATLSCITAVPHVEEAVATADLVIEAVPEVMALKRATLRQIAAAASPITVIATNTSAFDIDDLAEVVDVPSRFLGAHWYNPAYLVPCVEVIAGAATSDPTVQQTFSLLKGAGKLPVLAANTAGFVGNRLQFALIAEAFRCLQDGAASPADIDTIVRTSFGMRLAEYGPFELADMGGLDIYHSVLSHLAEHLGPRFTPPAVLSALVEQGRLGIKTASGVYSYTTADVQRVTDERDRRLAQRLSTAAEDQMEGSR